MFLSTRLGGQQTTPDHLQGAGRIWTLNLLHDAAPILRIGWSPQPVSSWTNAAAEADGNVQMESLPVCIAVPGEPSPPNARSEPSESVSRLPQAYGGAAPGFDTASAGVEVVERREDSVREKAADSGTARNVEIVGEEVYV